MQFGNCVQCQVPKEYIQCDQDDLNVQVVNHCFGSSAQAWIAVEILDQGASIAFLGSFILFSLAAYGLACVATNCIGPHLLFIFGGTATLVLAGLVLTHPAIRTLD